MGRGDLTNEEWSIIGRLLPPERGRKARPAHDNRQFLDGMLYVLRVGCPWRDMHECYGKWNSVGPLPPMGPARRLGRFAGHARGPRADRRLAAHDRLDHFSRPQPGCRRKGGTCKEGFGRSRGGFTSKIHARSDGQGRPLGFVLTGGEASDYKAVDRLFRMPVRKPRLMLADKGYDSDEVRSSLLMRGVLPVIPPRANRKDALACDFHAYKDRNRIERMFNRLKQARRIATRYDKTAVSFISFLYIAASRLWLKHYVNRT